MEREGDREREGEKERQRKSRVWGGGEKGTLIICILHDPTQLGLERAT